MRPRSDAANDHVTFGCEYLASGFRYCVHFPVLPSTLTFPLSHFYFFNDNDFSPPPGELSHAACISPRRFQPLASSPDPKKSRGESK
jgi:hypothetical protein